MAKKQTFADLRKAMLKAAGPSIALRIEVGAFLLLQLHKGPNEAAKFLESHPEVFRIFCRVAA